MSARVLFTQKLLGSGFGRLFAAVPEPIFVVEVKPDYRLYYYTFTVGDRSALTGGKLWQSLPEDYQKTFTYSDCWQPYLDFVDLDCHQQCLKEEGQTNHLERWWASLRNRLGRLTRKTLSFSKSLKALEDALTVFVYSYNQQIYQKYNPNNT